MTDLIQEIDNQIKTHPIILYMKGTPEMPQCGFSAKAASLLMKSIQNAGSQFAGNEFFAVNILARQDIRQALPQYSNWPTFPQLFIKGELIGGCDIMTELHEQGALQDLVKKALVE